MGLRKGDHAVKPVGETNVGFEGMRRDKANAACMLKAPFSALAE